MTDNLLTVNDVAKRLKMSRSAVYAMTDAGLIDCYRLPCKPNNRGVIRFDEAQVQAYLDRYRAGPQKEPRLTARPPKLKHLAPS